MSRPFKANELEALVGKGKDERASVQKKTFTKWVNSHLMKKNHKIKDLFTDLRDGVELLELLSLISGDPIPRPEHGKAANARFVASANIAKALAYLKTKVVLENIGPNDIADGNPVLTMGLMWTIILRFQIQDISFDELSAKDALLLWVKKKTKGYPGVDVNDFHKSFRDGLAFNALIHAHRPDLIDYDSLKPDDWVGNLNNAFTVAEDKLGILALLEAPDVAVEKPDERSIMTYVAALYHYFTTHEKGEVAGQRISNIIKELAEVQKLQDEYERRVKDLITWINQKIEYLDGRKFPNTIEGVQGLQGDFRTYTTTEKPAKIKEKSEQEAEFFNIQSKLRAMNRPRYHPKEGRSLHDISQAWAVLETAEHDRELALNQELARLRKLEQDAKRFEKKNDKLNVWMAESEKIIAENQKENSDNVDAALKKNEAIMADVAAHEDRVSKVLLAAKHLETENYRDKAGIKQKAAGSEARYKKLNAELLKRRKDLLESSKLNEFYESTRKALEAIVTTYTSAASKDYGADRHQTDKHLKRLAYVEAEVTALKDKVNELSQAGAKLSKENPDHANEINAKVDELKTELSKLDQAAKVRKDALENAKKTHAIMGALEDEDLWIQEKAPEAQSEDYGKDATSSNNMLKRHDVLMASIKNHEVIIAPVLAQGHQIGETESQVKEKTVKVEDKWNALQKAAKDRRELLEAAALSQQYYAAADDTEKFIHEKEPLISSTDLGQDEESAQALAKKHQALSDELDSYEFDLNALRGLAKKLVDKNNHESPKVAERQQEIEDMWAKLRDQAVARKKALDEADKYHKFNQDAEEMAMWIDDKEKFLKEAKLSGDLDNLDSLLRKFEEVGRDFAKHEAMLKDLNKDADVLIKDEHPNKDLIAEKRDKLNDRWKQLAFELDARKAELKDAGGASALLLGLNNLDELLRQKEKQASSEDYGKDLPSTLAQKKKQEALNRDIDDIAAKVNDFHQQSLKFIEENPNNQASETLAQKQKELEEELEKVQGLAAARTKKLDDAHKLHKFLADAHEAELLLAQKDKETDAIERPKDMRGAEAGLRKLDKLMKAVEANDDRMKELQEAGDKLVAEGHPASDEVKDKLATLKADREALGEKQKAKEKELLGIYDLEKFREDYNDASNWMAEKRREADSEEMPKDTADAHKMIKRAEDLKNETEAYNDNLKKVEQQGLTLVNAGHPEKEAIQKMLDTLVADRQALSDAVDARKKKLDESLSLLAFDRDAQEIEDWLDEAESVLHAKQPESIEAINELIKKNEALQAEAKLEAQKVKALDNTATRLIGEDHHAKEHIGERRDKIMDRWNSLDTGLAKQKKDLETASKLQQYLKDADELHGWATDKQAELNDALQNPDSLSEKDRMKKQEELELDLASKRKNLEELKKTLKDLEGEDGFDASEAKKKTEEIEALLNSLNLDSEKSSKQIKEAASLHQAERDFKDHDLWLKEVEAALANEDLGADLPAAQALFKKHAAVEADIKAHENPINQSLKAAQALIDADHYATENLKQKKDTLASRYAALQEKAKDKRAKLEESLKQHKFLRDVEEERKYVKYKATLASSTDYGRDTTSCQKLLSKTKVLSEELANHEKTVYVPLKETGAKLLAEKAVSEESVAPALASLAQDWEKLKAQVADREKKLVDNAEWLEFKADQDDEATWLEEQINNLQSAPLPGDSMSSCKAMMKQNQSLLSEIKNHESRIQSLIATGDSMIAKGHSHEADIKRIQKDLAEKLATLQSLANTRKNALEFALQRQVFNKDVSGIQTFMKNNQEMVNRDNLGQDQAATKKLLDELVIFETKCDAVDAQVDRLVASTASLVSAEHPDSAFVQSKSGEVEKDWAGFKTKRGERKELLAAKLGNLKATDDSCLSFAEQAAALNNWIDNAIEDLTDSVTVNSVEEAEGLNKAHSDFEKSQQETTASFEQVVAGGKAISDLGVKSNPYTPYTTEVITEKWNQTQEAAAEKSKSLDQELERQKDNDKLRRDFAKVANEFAQWLEATKAALLEGGNVTLEEQLENIKAKNAEIEAKSGDFDQIQELSNQIEAALILDNKYTEHSAISLAQKLEALKKLGTGVQFNTEQKIAAKNNSGITEEEKKEWEETFEYFDKNKTGTLDHLEFKSCLRSLGFNLPVVAEGQKDEEFEQILSYIDASGDGQISKQEFFDFMVTQKTTKASTAQEVISSFMMIAHDQPFVTEEQLRATLPENQVEYCLKHMKPVEGGYDYEAFVNDFFSTEDSNAFAAKNTPVSTPPVSSWNDSRAEKLKATEQLRQQRKEKAEKAVKEQEASLQEQKRKREASRK